MRRKLSLLLCAALCLLLCACGAAQKAPTTAPADVPGVSSTAVPTTAAPTTAVSTTAAPPTTQPPEPAAPTAPAATATTAAPTTAPTTTAAKTAAAATTTRLPQTTKAAAARAAATAAKATTQATTTAAPTTAGPTTAPATEPPQSLSCTISVDCKTLLNHFDVLDEAKQALVPSNGVLLSARTVSFKEGETVFDVLKRICRANGIQMEFSMTPVYGSAYIEGIGNLYEFDGGPLSGWMYSVNGTFPNVGCSSYDLQNGDVIVWRYTCDLGHDIGGRNEYQ